MSIIDMSHNLGFRIQGSWFRVAYKIQLATSFRRPHPRVWLCNSHTQTDPRLEMSHRAAEDGCGTCALHCTYPTCPTSSGLRTESRSQNVKTLQEQLASAHATSHAFQVRLVISTGIPRTLLPRLGPDALHSSTQKLVQAFACEMDSQRAPCSISWGSLQQCSGIVRLLLDFRNFSSEINLFFEFVRKPSDVNVRLRVRPVCCRLQADPACRPVQGSGGSAAHG